MISYKQGDPRWAEEKMLPSEITLKRAGCVVTAIADLSTYFGDFYDPGIVCRRVKFTPSALIYWQSCLFPSFKFSYREYGRNDAGIWAALQHPDRAVILQVNNGQHWVVATSWNTWSKVFKIADPFFGDRSDMRRYGDNITGAAYFNRI